MGAITSTFGRTILLQSDECFVRPGTSAYVDGKPGPHSDHFPESWNGGASISHYGVRTSEKGDRTDGGRIGGPQFSNEYDTLFRFGVVGDLSDGQLVQRFLNADDEVDHAAFTARVDRHGPMVLGVCREVLGNTHDAQDAFQATFLVLARKAASVRKTDSVASWLHGVALRVAVRAKAHATRRRVYERRSAVMRAAEFASERGSPECWPELHEEIARLPQHYREPVVLCYLEGLSTEAAALRIGCPKGTVLSRLSRARERLRGRLDRRGLGLPAVGLAANLTLTVRTALPARLLDTTVRASLSFAGRLPAEATFASATATTLARGMLYTMTVSKLAILGAAGLAGVFALGSAQTFGWLGGLERAQEPTQSASGTTDPQEALARSVNNLESELDESARRNAGMRKELQEIRAGLNALLNAPKRTALVARAALTQLANALECPKPTEAVARLADVLKHHPAKPSADQGWNYQLYMLDLVEGGTTLIADEPIPDLICSGLPAWSHDGNRIVFDTAGSRVAPGAINGDRGTRRSSDIHGSRRGQSPDLFPGRQADRVLAPSPSCAGRGARDLGHAGRRHGTTSRRRIRGSLLVSRRPRVPDQ